MQYFVGKKAKLTIPDIKVDGQVVDSGVANFELKVRDWEYVKVKTPVDISNTNSYGAESYIGNLTTGTINCTGYLNDQLYNSLFTQNNIPPGTYAKFELFVDSPALALKNPSLAEVIPQFILNVPVEVLEIIPL